MKRTFIREKVSLTFETAKIACVSPNVANLFANINKTSKH